MKDNRDATVMAATSQIEMIHESIISRQRQQMVDQINEYGLCDFWADYGEYLKDLYVDGGYSYFEDAVISYHTFWADYYGLYDYPRITNR